MKLSPVEIQRQEFKKTLRGFDPHEVRSFLAVIAQAVEELRHENEELAKRSAELETQLKGYRSVEMALQQTFVQAQETSGKAMENARRESQLIIQEAEMKASLITEKARNELINLREQVTILRAKKDAIISRLKMLLHSELDVIKALEVEDRLHDRDQLSLGLSKEKMEIEEIVKSLE